MLLAIDAGNTNTVFAVSQAGAKPAAVWRIRTESARTADEYASWLLPLMAQAKVSFSDISDVVIGSVVPDANFHLRKFCDLYVKTEPLFVDAGIDTGIVIDLPKPEEVGADRIVNAVAAIAAYRTPCIIIDFGTATTFDVVNAKGAYIGGVIAPGINLSIDALHRAAAKLPKVSIKKPEHVIGRDTVSAMKSGIFWGYIAMMEGLLARITSELGAKPHVIATGGLAPVFAGSMQGLDAVDEDLTLRGLQMIYARHNNKKAAA
jgi:type III pantothenate kinase